MKGDGNLNNDTHDLMSKSRCRNPNIIFDFRTSALKWNKPIVTWYYYFAMQELMCY